MLLTETYADKIKGVLSCYDRMIIKGTVPQVCFAQGMTCYLNAKKIRIFVWKSSNQYGVEDKTPGRYSRIRSNAVQVNPAK